MQFDYRITAIVIGSFVLGLGVVSVLHAQTKPHGLCVCRNRCERCRTVTQRIFCPRRRLI